ncbi:MAG: nitroreductase family protein [DPANN group archaeon]|nr:nitroreductase family protein [DPANN group archaeon]
MDILEAIKTRRSIRRFRPHRIPQDVLTQILDAAGDAPSAGNFQPWRIIVVTDKDKKEIIAKAAFEQYWISTAPVVLVICSSLGNMEKDYGKRADLYRTQSVSAAVQSLMLAAHSLGISSCWVGDFVETKIRKAFSIPDGTEIDAIVPLGYAAEKPKPKHRLEVHDYTYIGKWDERGRYATIPLRETLTALHERLKELRTKLKPKVKK